VFDKDAVIDKLNLFQSKYNFYTNVGARLIHQFVSRKLVRRTQAWRGT